MSRGAADAAKRLVDIVVAGLAVIGLLPVFVAVAALVAVTLGRPVLFRQTRVGRHGRPFVIVKFRTMHPVDPDRGLVHDGARITVVGQLLRRGSLDELPNLWNVLVGQMSLVGPRPLIVDDLYQHAACPVRRHEVRPGLTGLAQISGRNSVSWTEKFELDVRYVEQRSLALDARIMMDTVGVVLRGAGIERRPEPVTRAMDPAGRSL